MVLVQQRGRPKRWRGEIPSTAEEARLRLLEAALACCGRIGIERLTIGDVADEAGVHRSTVYEYFANRDVLLEAIYHAEADRITQKVSSHHAEGRAFIDALLDSIIEGVELTKRSANLTYLMSAGVGVRSDQSDTAGLRATIAVLGRHMVDPMTRAVSRGELRDDVPVDELIAWVVRVAISLTGQPPENVRQILNWFLVPALVARGSAVTAARRGKKLRA
ncbi:transcriptional regulator, TetR family [Burkholderia sp. H160]|nr:transcriptional regulator, TetR family [Burkholderia sp. H160]